MPDNHKVSINSHGWLYYKGEAIIDQFFIIAVDAVGGVTASRIDASTTSADIRFVPSCSCHL